MKASKEFVRTIKADCKSWYESLDDTKKDQLKKFGSNYKGNKQRIYWSVFWNLHDINDYSNYMKGLKDDHIETAIKRAVSIPYLITGKSLTHS